MPTGLPLGITEDEVREIAVDHEGAQSLTGPLTIEDGGADAILRFYAPNGLLSGEIRAVDNLLILRRYDSGGTPHDVSLYDSYVESANPVRAPTTLSTDNAQTLTTKDYANAAHLQLEGPAQSLKKALTVDPDGGDAVINLYSSGVLAGQIRAESSRLILRRYTAGGSPIDTYLYDTYVESTQSVRAPSTQAADVGTTLTTKDYVDAEIAAAGGGGTTDHGALTGLGDDDHTQYHTDARGDARYLQLSGGVLTGALTLPADPTANLEAATKQYVDGEVASHTHTVSEITDFDPADYVDRTTAQSVGGVKTFTDNPEIQGTGFPGLTIEKTDVAVGNIELKFDQQGANKAVIYYTPGNDRLNFRKQDGGSGSDTDFQLHDTYASFNKEVRGVDPTANSGLTTKQYVDGEITSHTHVKADITDFSDTDYATAAQGATADSATQPGDNISTLTNDAGYLTDITAEAVGDLSDVTNTAPALRHVLVHNGTVYANRALVEADISDLGNYADSVHTHVVAEITDFDPNDYVAKAGSTMSGNLRIEKANPQLVVEALGTDTVQVFFDVDNVLKGAVITFDDGVTEYIDLRKYDGVGTLENYLRVLATHIETQNKIRSASTLAGDVGTTLTTKDYVDAEVAAAAGTTDHGALTGLGDDDHTQYHTDARGDARYLQLTGGTLTGDLTLRDGGSDTSVIVDADSAYNPVLLLERDGTPTVLIVGGENYFWLRRFHSTGGTNPELRIHDDHFEFKDAPVVLGVSPTVAAHAVRKDYVDGNFVDLSTAQTVGGLKTFSDDVRIDKSTGNPAVGLYRNGSIATNLFALATNTLLRHYAATDTELRLYDNYLEVNKNLRAPSTQAADIATTLTTKDYVDAEVAAAAGTTDHGALTGLGDDDHTQYHTDARGDLRYLQLTGGTLTGALTLPADPTANLDAATKQYVDAEVAAVTGTTDHGALTGLSDDDHTQYHTDARGDARYLQLTGGTVSGDVQFKDGSSDTTLSIDVDAGFNPVLRFERDNVLSAIVVGGESSFWVRRIHSTGGTNPEFRIYDDHFEFKDAPVVLGVTPTAAAHAVRKDYVDGNFVDLSTAQTVGGLKTFSDDVRVDKPSGNPAMSLYRNGSISCTLFGLSSNTLLRHYAATDTELRLYDNYLEVNKNLRAPSTQAADIGTTLTTKDYVDGEVSSHTHVVADITDFDPADYVDLTTAQSVGGAKTFTDNPEIHTSGFPSLTINKTDTGGGNIELKLNQQGANKAVIYYTPGNDRLNFRKQDGGSGSDTDFQLHDTYASFNKEVRGVAPTANSGLTTKQYVDDAIAGVGAGTSDHGALTGLGDDDHTQYHTDARGDARYAKLTGATFSGGVVHNGTVTHTGLAVVRHASSSSKLLLDQASGVGGTPTVELARAGAAAASLFSFLDRLQIEWSATGTALSLHDTRIEANADLTINTDANASLNVDSGAANNAHVYFKGNGVNRGIVWTNPTQMTLRHYHTASGTNTQFELTDDFIRANKDLRCTSMGSDVDSVTTKSYVDDNFVDTAGDTMTGTLNVPAGSVSTPGLKVGGTRLWGDDNGLKIGDNDQNWMFDCFSVGSGTFLRLFDTAGEDAHLEIYEATGGYIRQSKERSGSDYEIVWPKDPPTAAGQQLQVKSITGTTFKVVVMEWA